MQDSPDSFYRKLTTLQRLTEALSRKIDLLLNGNHRISQEDSGIQNEQSHHQFSKTTYGKFQQNKGHSLQCVRPNHAPIVVQHIADEVIQHNQPSKNNSATVLKELAFDSARDHPAAVLPHLAPIQQYPRPYNPYQISRQNHPTVNRWQCWSCCMLWLGLSQLLGGIIMLILGSILLYKYFNPGCPSPYTIEDNSCCYLQICLDLLNALTIDTAISLLGAGFIAGIIGIVFLTKAHKFYRNNLAKCC